MTGDSLDLASNMSQRGFVLYCISSNMSHRGFVCEQRSLLYWPSENVFTFDIIITNQVILIVIIQVIMIFDQVIITVIVRVIKSRAVCYCDQSIPQHGLFVIIIINTLFLIMIMIILMMMMMNMMIMMMMMVTMKMIIIAWL